MDNNVKLSTEVFVEAAKHDGTSVVENCVILNDGIYNEINAKEVREESQIYLKHGEPMIFGKERDKGLILDGLKLKVVRIGEDGITEDDILIHKANENNPGIAMMLANMRWPNYPVALGVIRSVNAPTYDMAMESQISKIQAEAKIKNVDDLLHSGNTWEV